MSLSGFVDLSATIVDAAGLDVPEQFVGTSLLGLLDGDVGELEYDRAVFSGRERHSSSRYQNLSYPQRMMRRGDFLITWNARPELDPAGQPRSIVDGELSAPHTAYFDIDDSMIKRELIAKRDDFYIGPFFHLAVDKRPEWQLFNVADDPECLIDLANDPEHARIVAEYKEQLTETLTATGDPRVLGYGDVWEDYPRVRGPMRYFPQQDHRGLVSTCICRSLSKTRVERAVQGLSIPGVRIGGRPWSRSRARHPDLRRSGPAVFAFPTVTFHQSADGS